MSNPQEFNPASLDQWAKAAAKSAPGGDVSALNWVTPEGITVKPLYTAADTAELPFAKLVLIYIAQSIALGIVSYAYALVAQRIRRDRLVILTPLVLGVTVILARSLLAFDPLPRRRVTHHPNLRGHRLRRLLVRVGLVGEARDPEDLLVI